MVVKREGRGGVVCPGVRGDDGGPGDDGVAERGWHLVEYATGAAEVPVLGVQVEEGGGDVGVAG